MHQWLHCILESKVLATASAVHHNPQMFCLPSLQLCRKFHTSLAWLLSNAQKKLTGSGRLVLKLFLSLSLQSDLGCYHLISCSTFIFSICVVWACMCVCFTAWNSALQCESCPDRMRDFFVLSYQASDIILTQIPVIAHGFSTFIPPWEVDWGKKLVKYGADIIQNTLCPFTTSWQHESTSFVNFLF